MTATLQANGIRIAYRLDGPENAPVVLFSNSLMSNFSMWEAQLAPVTAKYRKCCAMISAATGATETTPGPYTIELLTEDAFALTEALGIERVHFVGLSMGGFSGQMMATPPSRQALVPGAERHRLRHAPRVAVERAHPDGRKPKASRRWPQAPWNAGSPRRSIRPAKSELDRVRTMILGTKAEGYIACAQAIRDMRLCDDLPPHQDADPGAGRRERPRPARSPLPRCCVGASPDRTTSSSRTRPICPTSNRAPPSTPPCWRSSTATRRKEPRVPTRRQHALHRPEFPTWAKASAPMSWVTTRRC